MVLFLVLIKILFKMLKTCLLLEKNTIVKITIKTYLDSDTMLNEQELIKIGIKHFDKKNLEYVRRLGNGKY